jgi:hypothetical protein
MSVCINSLVQGDVLGLEVVRSGRWNLTLRDYSQTTRVRRAAAGVDVRVEVDHIGDMEIHVENLLRGGNSIMGTIYNMQISRIIINYKLLIISLLMSVFWGTGLLRDCSVRISNKYGSLNSEPT